MPPQNQPLPPEQPIPSPLPPPPAPQPQPQPQPIAPVPQPTYTTPPPAPTPNKSKKWLLVGIIVGVVVVIGAVAWFMYNNNQSKDTATTAGEVLQSPETAMVRNVTWVEPTPMPSQYEKFDESDGVVKTFYYDDVPNDCSLATDIAPWGSLSRYGKTPKEVALDLEQSEEEGVKITKNEPAQRITLKDIDGQHEYAFDTMELAKDLTIKDLDYNKEYTLIAYKPFGVYAASIRITCKEETWNTQRGNLENLMKQFTLRTER